jgi:hypothetical protein
VVTTRTLGSYSGQLMFFKNQGKKANPVFLYKSVQTLAGDIPLAVAVTDIDGDAHPDVVIGTQWSEYAGSLQYWRNSTPSTFGFTKMVHFDAPGIVTTLVAADFGGNAGKDLAVGFRTSSTGFGGGLRIYYTDAGTLLDNGVDPSGGSIVNFVPAITTGNFNYGVYPVPPSPPFLIDLAAGVKSSDSTGALVVVMR